MSSRSRTTTVAVGVALVVVAVCLTGVWGAYLVSRSDVPAPSELHVVAGEFQSCEVEASGLLGPMNSLHGAWEGASTHILKLREINAEFRTLAFDCGMGNDEDATVAGLPGAITLSAQEHPVEAAPGAPPLYNAYGLTVNGVVMRAIADDIAEHRRAQDVIAPINIAGLLLLALVLPGLLIGALRGDLWRDNEAAHAPRDSNSPVESLENPAGE